MIQLNRLLVLAIVIFIGFGSAAVAGMPTPLPTGWSAPESSGRLSVAFIERRLQALSFFIVCLFVAAFGIKLLWNALRRDLQWLPVITYGRAVAFTMLWGLLFVIVLTMISGARELMTPGAWQKQGWTYQLRDEVKEVDFVKSKKVKALETLRFALWRHAASNDGQFPEVSELSDKLLNIPGRPGLRFEYIPGEIVSGETTRLLVVEPTVDKGNRFVLTTNGVIGTLSSQEIFDALESRKLKVRYE
ncbi:MAG: hypothetical protein CMJ78_24855 [Planctomycetaceae bacterium]|nr:hypothetical protein [Planctomycetaceae bacterium]